MISYNYKLVIQVSQAWRLQQHPPHTGTVAALAPSSVGRQTSTCPYHANNHSLCFSISSSETFGFILPVLCCPRTNSYTIWTLSYKRVEVSHVLVPDKVSFQKEPQDNHLKISFIHYFKASPLLSTISVLNSKNCRESKQNIQGMDPLLMKKLFLE